MKKIFAFLVILALILPAYSSHAADNDNKDYTTVTFNDRIQIQLPGKWTYNGKHWINDASPEKCVVKIISSSDIDMTSKQMENNRSKIYDELDETVIASLGYKVISIKEKYYNGNIHTDIITFYDEENQIFEDFIPFWDDYTIYYLLCIHYQDYDVELDLGLDEILKTITFIGGIKSRQMDIVVDDIQLEPEAKNMRRQEQFESPKPKEITFRGIPWGSTYQEVIAALSDWGVKFRNGESIKCREIDSLINNNWSRYHKYECGYYTYTAFNSPTKQVAGYDIDDIQLYFAFVPNKEGKIDGSTDNTSFFLGQYKIKPVDINGVFEDLKNKLSSLYGDPAKESNDGIVIHYSYCYWNGPNDTMVVIVTDDNWDCIYINYVWNKGDELLDIADQLLYQAEVDKEKEKFGLENTDGL